MKSRAIAAKGPSFRANVECCAVLVLSFTRKGDTHKAVNSIRAEEVVVHEIQGRQFTDVMDIWCVEPGKGANRQRE